MPDKPIVPRPDLAQYLVAHRDDIILAWYECQFNDELFRLFPNSFAESADKREVLDGHMAPLLSLLSEYARTGDIVYRDLYLAECYSYAPHREGIDILKRYFQAYMPAHIAAATGRAASPDWRTWMQDVHRPLTAPVKGQPIRILTIGDCLIAQIQGFLRARGLDVGIAFDFRFYYFSALRGVQILDDSVREAIRSGTDLIAISYLSYEGIPLYRSFLETAEAGNKAQTAELREGVARFIREHLNMIRELTDAPILLHNACGLPLRRFRQLLPFLPAMSRRRQEALKELNASIADISAKVENCFLIDENASTDRFGLRHCGDTLLPRSVARDAAIHVERLSQYLAEAYLDVVHDWKLLQKTKLLLVDFDNTLWGGVMADGPVQQYADRQELLRRLSEQGILLAAVSKNSPANIRWDEMVLSENDFASQKINWNLKVHSIREIAQELNLGTDSFVLLDDNPVELELVQSELPEVVCLDSTRAETWKTISRLFSMPNTRQTDEAKRRTQLYKEQARRNEAVRETSDHPELMRRLSLKAAIGPARSADLDRLAELVQRTNQFNTTTVRYSHGELEAMLKSSGYDVVVGELADKFGRLGIVCVAIVKKGEEESIIEDFVMSCRAMGFGMEQVMLNALIERSERKRIVGKFVPTAKNEPSSTFYKSSGFSEEFAGHWVLPAGASVDVPEWIAVENRD